MADVPHVDNPFLSRSPLIDEYPPFDRIRFEHYRPAFEAGMAEQLTAVELIATDPAPPTFANTYEALECSGSTLRRVSLVFENIVASDSTEDLLALEAELAPRLTAHRDTITQHEGLYARLREVYDARHEAGLDPEQINLVERIHTDFVRAGAGLDPDQKARLRELNGRLAELASDFGTRLLHDTNDLALLVDDASELDGLPDDALEAAAQAAKERGEDGYLLALVLPTRQPAEAQLTSRELRQRLHEAAVARGSRGNDWDTRATLTEIAAIRAERAALHGFPNHAAYVVDDETAGTTDAVTDRLLPMVAPAVANVARVRAELEERLHADGHDGPLQPWDWAYYDEKRRATQHQFDPASVRPHFPLDRVLRDGIFAAARELYGLSFRRELDLPLPHPDAVLYDVMDEAGEHVGLVVCDWFTRDSKRGGAWMHEFVPQTKLLGTRPVVTLTMNVPKPLPGQPALLTLDELDTAFHEFGHVLHGLLSDCRYARTAGTGVPRDFVEFPSQVNEMWAWWPDLLASYAIHHETRRPLSAEQVSQLLASQAEADAYSTLEILAATLLDWAWHLLPSGTSVPPDQVETFELEALERYGVRHDVVVPRYRSSYFSHIFSDAEGYSSRYYSYLWAEVLDADTVEWFREHGGLTRANGRRFSDLLLSRGGTVDVLAATTEFLGREPRIEPLLARHGLL
jgi:peptidyl-dipeptidase Dcp